MLIKEYRIPLPLTVEEYRIAQLFMIAKKSREESSGHGSGVEIIVNEPYENGPGQKGQYTRKIYHVGSHLPGWIKGVLPKSALTVEEEAWNAYPYTKTRYTCPFVEKFSLEIETYYFPDNGHQDNVFKLSGSDLRNRIVDVIDIVKDQLPGEYIENEDPRRFVSCKTARGPLDETWLEEHWEEVKGKSQPTSRNMSLMCAYKLCRVEFRYWGMQTKLEKFIHDTALRKTMVRAHRQAWCWQDEWHGLTMDDIREIEKQTQLALQKKMGNDNGSCGAEEEHSDNESRQSNQFNSIEKTEENSTPLVMHKRAPDEIVIKKEVDAESSEDEDEVIEDTKQMSNKKSFETLNNVRQESKGLPSPFGSAKSFDQVTNWRMEKLEVGSKAGSEEEFYDCLDMSESTTLTKWSSLELLPGIDDNPPSHAALVQEDSIFSHDYLKRVASERGITRRQFGHTPSIERSASRESHLDSPQSCATSILLLVFHAGSCLDSSSDLTAKKSDVTTLRGAMESVARQHYPTLVGHFIIKLVSCPAVCTDALGILSSLSPYSFDTSPSQIDPPNLSDIPIGAISLLTVCSQDFLDATNRTINQANQIYAEFLKSEDGHGFNGQVVILADSMGSILAHDALCRTSNDETVADSNVPEANRLHVTPSRRHSSTTENLKLDFEVSDFFMFGSPLSIILASRRLMDSKLSSARPHCGQVYNLFHPTDPVASRLEPLISARFSMISPFFVPRYAKFPLGNGQPYHLLEMIHTCPNVFSDLAVQRRSSEVSLQSNVSGFIDNIQLTTINTLQHRWWGTKRLDYALYCPEGLSSFPSHALPHLFHASYWESSDVIAFILRQVGRFDMNTLAGCDESKERISFKPGQPREKWNKKRTSVKLKNVASNHRANDVIVREGEPQKLTAKFSYGPLDMKLNGENVDLHIMKDGGEWTFLSTETTDKSGRIIYTIPDEKSVGYGIYPIKMVVRGDHTQVDFYLSVVPPQTEAVIFSIDGSFTASVSVTGRDPKVRAGAVDVCRHWQELGYLIIYITGRPDMQQQRVVSWLSQHNFPHGLVSFADGLSTDPLGHKAAYLNNLIQNHGIKIQACYGSSKDISVYTNIGLKPEKIFIVGKVAKKLQPLATPLFEGYAAHLSCLMAHGGSRPAQGNQRMIIPRGSFNLPWRSSGISALSPLPKPKSIFQ